MGYQFLSLGERELSTSDLETLISYMTGWVSQEQRVEFSKWLNEYGIPAIKKLTVDEYLFSNEDRRVSIDIDGVNPRSSCGYLYIGVYPCDNGDPNYIPAPVPSPKPKKPSVGGENLIFGYRWSSKFCRLDD